MACKSDELFFYHMTMVEINPKYTGFAGWPVNLSLWLIALTPKALKKPYPHYPGGSMQLINA